MVKKSFAKPNMEVIKFEADDIICTSGGGCNVCEPNTCGGADCIWHCMDCQIVN